MSLTGHAMIETLVPGLSPWAVARILLQGNTTVAAVLASPWRDDGEDSHLPKPVAPPRGMPKGELSPLLGWPDDESGPAKAKIATWLTTAEVATAAARYKGTRGKKSPEIEGALAMMRAWEAHGPPETSCRLVVWFT